MVSCRSWLSAAPAFSFLITKLLDPELPVTMSDRFPLFTDWYLLLSTGNISSCCPGLSKDIFNITRSVLTTTIVASGWLQAPPHASMGYPAASGRSSGDSSPSAAGSTASTLRLSSVRGFASPKVLR